MADPELVAILAKGVEEWNRWARAHAESLWVRRIEFHADLAGIDLNGADLAGVHLQYSVLVSANLAGANLTGADLGEADLTDADLTGADLTGANLHGAFLQGASLRGAVLRGADLFHAFVGEADLEGADLRDANLDSAFFAGGPPTQTIEVRSSRRMGVLALVVGLFGLAVAIAFEPMRTPLFLLAVGALLFSGPLLVFDRRVKLALSQAGIRYYRWGRQVVPWYEFSGYRRATWRQQPHLQLVPRRPSELAAGFSAYGRLNHFCYRIARMPPFSIAVHQLEIDEARLGELVARHLPEQLPE